MYIIPHGKRETPLRERQPVSRKGISGKGTFKIKENDFNLNIPRYVDTFEEEEVVPLSEIVTNIKTTRQEITKTTNEIYNMLDELVDRKQEEDAELKAFIEQLKAEI